MLDPIPEKGIHTTNNLIVDAVCIEGVLELRVTVEGKMYFRQIDKQSLNWIIKRIADAINNSNRGIDNG